MTHRHDKSEYLPRKAKRTAVAANPGSENSVPQLPMPGVTLEQALGLRPVAK